jgi:hypothetical protein
LVIPSSIVSRDNVMTLKPTLSHLKDSSGRSGNKMRWSLTLDRQLLRLLWLHPKNWAPDVTTNLVLSVEPVSYQNAATSSQSGPTTLLLYPLPFGVCCLWLCNVFKALSVFSSIFLYFYKMHFTPEILFYSSPFMTECHNFSSLFVFLIFVT